MAMEEFSVHRVVEAINVLYNDQDPAKKSQANLWLDTFLVSASSWSTGLHLLIHESIEVSYFCANLLLSKVHRDWNQLDGNGKKFFQKSLNEKFVVFMSEPHRPPILVNRFCLLLAAVTFRFKDASSENLSEFSIESLIQRGLQSLETAPFDELGLHASATVIQLFLSIAEELEHLDSGFRAASLKKIGVFREQLLHAITSCLTKFLSDSNKSAAVQSKLQGPILQTIRAWLVTVGSLSSRVSLSAAALKQQHFILWQFLLFSIGSADFLCSDAAVEVLSTILSAGENYSGANSEQSSHVDACRHVMHTILSHRSSLAVESRDFFVEDMEKGLCRIAVSLSECATSSIASSLDACKEGLPLSEMMLECAGRGDQTCVELVVDYFSMLNTLPVALRLEPFKGPYFIHLLQILLQKAAYPPDFITWKEAAEDEDSFHRFRDQVVAEGIEACYNLVPLEFLNCLRALLESANSWQQIEATLYGVRCISSSIRAKVLNPSGQAFGTAEQVAAVESFFSALFGNIAQSSSGGGVFFSHPVLVESVCRLVGSYSQWFNVNPQCLEGILSYLVRAFQVPSAVNQASKAFLSLCSHTTSHLNSVDLLRQIAKAADSAISPNDKSGEDTKVLLIEEREFVVEGLGTIIASLPAENACEAAIFVATPFVRRAQNLAGDPASQTVPTDAESAALSSELKLLSVVFKSCCYQLSKPPKLIGSLKSARDSMTLNQSRSAACTSAGIAAPTLPSFPSRVTDSKNDPSFAVAELAKSMLSQVLDSPRWHANRFVFPTVCSVLAAMISVLIATEPTFAAKLVPLVVSVFEKYQHRECLQVLSVAMEASVDREEDSFAGEGTYRNVLEAVTQASCLQAQRGGIPHRPEIFQSLLEMAYRFLRWKPSLVLGSSALPQLFLLASSTVHNQERESSKSALHFLDVLLSPADKSIHSQTSQKFKSIIDSCLQQHGKSVVHSLLSAAGGVLPRDLIRLLASVFYSIVTAHSSISSFWVLEFFSDPNCSLFSNNSLSQSDAKVFCDLVFKQPPLSRAIFESMMQDFANVCRREGTGDLLVAYQFW